MEVTGETVDGHPVFVAGTLRLVLPEGTHHFRRLRVCVICGKEMTGRPVLQRRGLDLPDDPHMCQDCSAAATGGA